MEQQTIATFSNQLDQIKQALVQNEANVQQQCLQTGLKFVSQYTAQLVQEKKTAEWQITNSLLAAVSAMNEQPMNPMEWLDFSAYLHDVANLILKTTMQNIVKPEGGTA